MTDADKTLQCINPSQVTPEDIPAYHEGEGRPEFAEHLAKCPFCRKDLAEYRALEKMLSARLKRSRPEDREGCPETQVLINLSFNLLDEAQAIQVREHLVGCSKCQNDYAQFKPFEAGIQETPDSSVNVEAVLKEAATRALGRITAQLVSFPPELQFTVRGAASDNQLIFEAAGVTILLHRYQDKSGLILEGTVSRDETGTDFNALAEPNYSQVKVMLLQEEALLKETNLDEAGTFYFEKIAASSVLSIELLFPDLTVVIPLE